MKIFGLVGILGGLLRIVRPRTFMGFVLGILVFALAFGLIATLVNADVPGQPGNVPAATTPNTPKVFQKGGRIRTAPNAADASTVCFTLTENTQLAHATVTGDKGKEWYGFELPGLPEHIRSACTGKGPINHVWISAVNEQK